jgi:hypothetical protein
MKKYFLTVEYHKAKINNKTKLINCLRDNQILLLKTHLLPSLNLKDKILWDLVIKIHHKKLNKRWIDLKIGMID